MSLLIKKKKKKFKQCLYAPSFSLFYYSLQTSKQKFSVPIATIFSFFNPFQPVFNPSQNFKNPSSLKTGMCVSLSSEFLLHIQCTLFI